MFASLSIDSERLFCNSAIKVLGASSLTGAVIWLGKSMIPLSFQHGFLFSAISFISIKNAYEVDKIIRARFKASIIIHCSVFCSIAIGIPLAVIKEMTPLNAMTSCYLIAISLAARQVFRVCINKETFL